MGFSYAPGSRPLEPYTIKHAIGSGGFGEVYYAVSDGGKEVALKCLRRETVTELRGFRACLNLSHPHLVAIHDLRQAADGTWWVVMEYVPGATWAGMLSENPNGLPLDAVVNWFGQLAAAVDFLHQHGIVHRDLKPSNIFLADVVPSGWVKVGDYGLSKLVLGQPNETHTQVGTVYYMAPEMAQGKYGPAVDVYAAGVILYQLLTGRVPFDGQSVQEILLRHLTDEADWSRLPSAVVPVVRQALAKDPTTRFACLGEMAQQLERVTGKASVKGTSFPTQAGSQRASHMAFPRVRAPKSQEPSTIVYPQSHRWYELARSLVISLVSGTVLAIFLAVIGWNLRPDLSGVQFAWTGMVAISASWALLTIQRLWWDQSWPEVWVRCLVRVVLGMLVGILAAWLSGASWRWYAVDWPASWMEYGAREMTLWHSGLRGAAYFGVLFLFVPWEHLQRPTRRLRFDWNPVLLITLFAGVLVWFWQQWEEVRWSQEWPKVFAAGLTALLIQWASRHEAPAR